MDGRVAVGYSSIPWQVGITQRNDRCLPTAAHCPYTSCITHIDYLPFSTLRVDSTFKSNLVPLLYCDLIDLGGLWTFAKMIKFLTYEKKKANNHEKSEMGEIFAIFAIWEWKTLKTTTYVSFQLRLLKLWYNNCGVMFIFAIKAKLLFKEPFKDYCIQALWYSGTLRTRLLHLSAIWEWKVWPRRPAMPLENRKEKANNHSTKSEMGQILQCHQNSNPAKKVADLRLWSRSGFASCCMIFESDKTFVTLSLQSQPCFRSFIISVFYGGVPTSGSL